MATMHLTGLFCYLVRLRKTGRAVDTAEVIDATMAICRMLQICVHNGAMSASDTTRNILAPD